MAKKRNPANNPGKPASKPQPFKVDEKILEAFKLFMAKSNQLIQVSRNAAVQSEAMANQAKGLIQAELVKKGYNVDEWSFNDETGILAPKKK